MHKPHCSVACICDPFLVDHHNPSDTTIHAD